MEPSVGVSVSEESLQRDLDRKLEKRMRHWVSVGDAQIEERVKRGDLEMAQAVKQEVKAISAQLESLVKRVAEQEARGAVKEYVRNSPEVVSQGLACASKSGEGLFSGMCRCVLSFLIVEPRGDIRVVRRTGTKTELAAELANP